ncbi:hypothetical protein AC1031_012470 [Aphanomyces cochlioides]|nr:hypothetical protein AC1031_012470 [Aphanomyces cochlioides]
MEVATTGAPAWSTIGQRLALQWRAPSSSPYFVTTCMKTKPTNANQVALVLMAGYDGFPQCQPPKGAQEIAGMAMVETTVRDEYPNGAFMLTVFADKTMSDSILHTNSDGTTDMLIANNNQTLIATNGSMTVDRLGVNGVHYSIPIGTRYKISIESYPVVLGMTTRIDPNTIAWWNVGRMSKKAVTMTWDYGHAVDNRTELVVLQFPFKRVMTNSFNAMNQLLFLAFEIVYMSVLPWILDDYRQSPQALSLNISGVLRPSGAYANDGQLRSAVSLLLPASMIIVASCMFVSVSLSTYYLKRDCNKFFLSLEWTRTNGFLSQCTMPNWITGLPLDEFKVIKIGNKLFCKPSMQATLGFATVVPFKSIQSGSVSPAKKNGDETYTLVSVYSLLPTLASLHLWLPKAFQLKIFGTSTKNEFTSGTDAGLGQDRYVHHRGTCLN